MKLLSDHPGATMSMAASQQLCALLKDTLAKDKISHVLETGTYRGLGSTTFIAEAFPKGHPPQQFVTIEANWVSWRHARRNLRHFPFVLPLWGKTVPTCQALQFLEADDVLRRHSDYPDIFIDDIMDPLLFYRREVQGKLGGRLRNPAAIIWRMFDRLSRHAGDNLLDAYLRKWQTANPLVVLDSAGGIGFLEFSILNETMKSHPYLVCLDDINHIKHFRSYLKIKNDPHFHMLGLDEREGWLFARYSP